MIPVLTRKIAIALVAALFVWAPTTALAQSAGDEQYQDPLGDDGGSTGSGDGSTGGGGSSGGGGGAPQPAPSGTPGTDPAPTTAAQAEPQEGTAAAPGELPRTGGNPVILAAFGIALALTGAGARLLVVRDPL
jgi:hypothetical protein